MESTTPFRFTAADGTFGRPWTCSVVIDGLSAAEPSPLVSESDMLLVITQTACRFVPFLDTTSTFQRDSFLKQQRHTFSGPFWESAEKRVGDVNT
tara:strand:- start:49 stop:333 length:285 start_codon:yes stop_codon:yes gene_type:complete